MPTHASELGLILSHIIGMLYIHKVKGSRKWEKIVTDSEKCNRAGNKHGDAHHSFAALVFYCTAASGSRFKQERRDYLLLPDRACFSSGLSS